MKYWLTSSLLVEGDVFSNPRKNVKITTKGINSKASQGAIEEIVYTWAISCDPWGQNVENWIATWSDDFSRAFLFSLNSSWVSKDGSGGGGQNVATLVNDVTSLAMRCDAHVYLKWIPNQIFARQIFFLSLGKARRNILFVSNFLLLDTYKFDY